MDQQFTCHYVRHTTITSTHTHTHTVTTCESCGGRPKRGEKLNRHCPSPNIVNGVLSTVSDELSCLTGKSKICIACYQYFKVNIKNFQQGVFSSTSACSESPTERNKKIDSIISELKYVQEGMCCRRESVNYFIRIL